MSRPVKLVFLADDTNLQRALGRLTASTAATTATLRKLQKTGADFHRMGRSITLGVTAPILAAAGGSAFLAARYQETMTKIQTLAGASKKQVDAWSQALLKLGPALGRTPQELAEGLYYIVSSGAKASDALDILVASAKAASVGLGDTQTVADLATAVLNAYGSENISAAKAVDILMRAVKNGKGEASEFASTIGTVIPLSAQLGISFDQVAAAMAAMTLVNSNTSEVATQLRGALSTLIDPSEQSRKAFLRLGTSSDEVRKSLREKGLLATLQDLKKRVGSNTEEFGKMFPNVRGLLGVLSLVGENSDNTARIFKDLAAAGGDVNKAFDTTHQTAMHKWRAALASLQASGIRMGTDMLPFFTKLVDVFAVLTKKFSDLDPQTRKLVMTIALLVAAVGPLLYVTGGLITAFTRMYNHPIPTLIALLAIAFITAYTNSAKFRDGVNSVVRKLVDMAKWIKENQAAILSLIGGFAAFYATGRIIVAFSAITAGARSLAMSINFLSWIIKLKFVTSLKTAAAALRVFFASFLASPIGIAVAAIVGIGVALFIAYKRSERFREIVNRVFASVSAFAVQAWAKITAGAKVAFGWLQQNVVPILMKVWAGIRVAFTAWMGFARVMGRVWLTVFRAIGSAIAWFARFLAKHWGVIKKIIAVGMVIVFGPLIAVVLAVVALFKYWVPFMLRAVRAVASGFATWFGFIRSTVWPILSTLVKIALFSLSTVWKIVYTYLRMVGAYFGAIFRLIWAIIRPTLMRVSRAWATTWKTVYNITTSILSAIRSRFVVFVNVVLAIWRAIASATAKVWAAIYNTLRTVVQNIVAAVSDRFNALKSIAMSVFSAVHDFVVGKATSIRDQVVSVFSAMGSMVGAAFGSVKDVLKSAINWIIDKVNGIRLPELKIAGHTVFDGWDGFKIPKLANGGLVTKPTIAMVGEAGPELVVPLTRKERMFNLLRGAGVLDWKPSAGPGGAVPAVSGGTTIDRSVKIENLNVTSLPTSADEIAREIRWSLRGATL